MRRAGRRLVRTAQPSKTGDAIIPSLFPGGRGMADRQTTQLRTKMLGAVLRQARTAAGRTLKETAAMIGVSSAILASYERGARGISLPELELLGYALPTKVDFFSALKGNVLAKAELSAPFVISLRQHY